MVAHQPISLDRHAEFLRVVSQQVEQRLVVRGGRENRLPVVAALDDVVRVAGECEAGKTGHEGDASVGFAL